MMLTYPNFSLIFLQYFEDEEVLDLLSLVPGAQGMEQYLQSLQCLKDEKDNAEQLLIRTSPQIGSDSVDSTLGRRIILIIQTLGAASGDVGTAEYIHIKQADKDCVLSGIRKILRRIGASR
nr:potassium transporter 7 [Ipomoea batatas]